MTFSDRQSVDLCGLTAKNSKNRKSLESHVKHSVAAIVRRSTLQRKKVEVIP